jgi:hypothetical protein
VRLADAARVYAIGYMLEPIRVRFKRSITLDTLVKLDAKEDESRALPRWLAKVLAMHGIADIQGVDMGIELLRALSREKIAGDKLNALKQDFYISIKDFINDAKRREQQEQKVNIDRLLITLQDIMLLRLDKIMNYAKSAYAMQEVEPRLSIEEKILIKSLHDAINEFKDYIVKDGKDAL